MSTIEEFLFYSNQTNSVEELCSLFQKSLEIMGFNKYRYGFLTEHKSVGKPANHGLQYNFPDDWMKHYIESGYLDVDPVKNQLSVSRTPFRWDKIDYFLKLNEKEKKVLEEAKDAGLIKGVGLAIHTGPGEVAGFGIASDFKDLEVTDVMLQKINLLAFQFHHRYLSLLQVPEQVADRIVLTSREKDVLSWLASGKSSSVIGEILSISENTVNYHIKQCHKKLEANNRILPVTKAIRLGLIDLISPKFII